MSEWVENSVNRQTDVAKPKNSAIPQKNPTRNFDFEQARMAIYFSDMRVRIRGPIEYPVVYFESGGKGE